MSLNKDPQVYTSRETRVVLRKNKLLQSSKKGHSWSQTIAIQITKRKQITVRVFLFPKVSDESQKTLSAKLDVTAEVKFCDTLLANGEDCSIKVQTEVVDAHYGHSIGTTEFPSHSVRLEEGGVSYRQDLVSCDRVRACWGNSVTPIIKATATISPQDNYIIYEEDSFAIVKKA